MAGHQGIKELMAAEQKASQIISAARQERGDRMKQAKIEADLEIKEYRAQLEKKFLASSDDVGLSNETKQLQLTTQNELQMMKQQFVSNKEKVIDLILKSCWAVSFHVPESKKNTLKH